MELGVEAAGDVALWSGVSPGVTPALTAFLAPLCGRLGDRFGRKVMVQRSLASVIVITASLTGIALSPVVAGILGATSIRGVFLLDVFALLALAAIVSRLMVTAPLARPTTPAPEI